MKRTSKRYVVTTSALNCYGYRVLTAGVDYTQFLNNPILLWMHLRADTNNKNQILPLGRAVDFQREGDKLTCALEFDETDEFAMQVYNKYENGTLSMLSLGAIALEYSEEPDMMVPGQYGPTVTRCKVLDISCVDRGGNDDAYACQLYDADANRIEMSNLNQEGIIKLFQSLLKTPNNKTDNMKLIQLTGAAFQNMLIALKMEEATSEAEVAKKVADLVQLNADQGTQVIQLTAAKAEVEGKLTNTTNELNAAKVKLADLEKADGEAKVIKLVDDNAKKFLPAQREHFIKLAGKDFDGTKALLESMPVAQTIAETVVDGKRKGTDYAALSYDQLDKSGKLIKLKAENPELFKEKFAERFGKEYTGTF